MRLALVQDRRQLTQGADEMQFRCPYCKADIGPVALVKCPKCGHVMAVRGKSDLKDRKTRRKKIEAIRSDAARRMQEIGGSAPELPHGPKFYLLLIIVFSGLLFVALNYSTRPQLKDGYMTKSVSNINLLAEAIGRFHFHTGVYPTTEQGLDALTWIETGRIPGYNGPYIMNKTVPKDGWKHPFRYTGAGDDPSDPLPTLVSAGPDGRFDTDDDIYPDPECFYRAGQDTSWTNEWVPYDKRGITILTKEQKAIVEANDARRRKRAAEEAAAKAAAAQADGANGGGAAERKSEIDKPEETK